MAGVRCSTRKLGRRRGHTAAAGLDHERPTLRGSRQSPSDTLQTRGGDQETLLTFADCRGAERGFAAGTQSGNTAIIKVRFILSLHALPEMGSRPLVTDPTVFRDETPLCLTASLCSVRGLATCSRRRRSAQRHQCPTLEGRMDQSQTSARRRTQRNLPAQRTT